MAHQIKGCDTIVDDAVEGVAVGGEGHIATRVDGARETGEAVVEAHFGCVCVLLEGWWWWGGVWKARKIDRYFLFRRVDL